MLLASGGRGAAEAGGAHPLCGGLQGAPTGARCHWEDEPAGCVTATLDPLGPRRGTRMLGTGFDRAFGCCVTRGIQVETGFHHVKPKRRACLAH